MISPRHPRTRILPRAWGALLCALTLLALLSAPAVLAAARVEGVRMADRESFTRFVADVPGLEDYEVFTMSGPDRLVIDIKKATWHTSRDALARAKSKLVRNIRYATHEGKLRIVLDLTQAVNATQVFIVPPGDDSPVPRMVVDFSPRRGAAPSTAVLKPKTLPKQQKAAEAPRRKEASASPPPAKPATPRARKPVIVLDPGHGGVDPGAMGRGKVREKQITFQYAIALKNELEKTGRYKVLLTRRGDYYVNLRKRVDVARSGGGDLFISLHADSHPDPRTRGLSIYTLSENASDKEAEALARRANREDVLEGVDLKGEPEEVKSVLIDMTQRDTKNLSARFAEYLVKQVGREARLLKNTHRFAGFVVLKGVDIPSVLVELGYLSNRHEERLLQTEAYKVKLVRAMVQAIDQYFKTLPKE